MSLFTLNKDLPLQKIVAPLLAWYGTHARVLPWRENRNPYRVWVSEIMLQQTRVEAVLPYYERFFATLPTISSLANAEEGVLLKLWEGLGYYARVRNLQKAAACICENYGGNFPMEYTEILALPGIGPYTAGAIASICFSQPTPAIDGNVLRVLTRLTEDDRDIASPLLRADLQFALEEIYPRAQPGDFTQSLMELGAMVCIPTGTPKCDECPLLQLCKANATGHTQKYPVRKKKAARVCEEKTLFLLYHGETIALCKRPAKGLLGGQWELPNVPGLLSEETALVTVSQMHPTELLRKMEKDHIFTHREWKMRAYSIQCEVPHPKFYWATPDELVKHIALPSAFKKFLQEE